MKCEPFTSQHGAELAQYLKATPLDFIRSIDFKRQAEDYAQELAHQLPEENDLRFVARDDHGSRFAVIGQILPWDSKFFGYTIAKLSGVIPLQHALAGAGGAADYAPLVREFLKRAKDAGVRYVFSRVDPTDLPLLRALGDTSFSLVSTGITYHRALSNYAYPARHRVRAARPEDVPTLAYAAEVMVNAFDRFHADPFINPKDADRLMREWVNASITKGFADITMVPDAPNPAAFLTVKYHKDKWQTLGLKVGQAVFGAVEPSFKGWYAKLISEIAYHLKDQGFDHMYMGSQITNKAVIRSWEKLGFEFGKAEHIFRIIL